MCATKSETAQAYGATCRTPALAALVTLWPLTLWAQELSAPDWIVANTGHALTRTDLGHLDTSDGFVAFIDPIVLAQPFEALRVAVPKTGGEIVVFEDKDAGNSKLALVFSDALVAGGTYAAAFAVDAGMASIFTPRTHAATERFFESLNGNAYDGFFHRYDEPYEPKIVTLPDGTPVPYITSGFGDGVYPVFTLQDDDEHIVAVYADFLGVDDEGNWLLPPGVTLD